MCRNPFQPGEVTRIHLDQRSFTSSRSPGSAHSSSSPPPPANPGSSLARELHDRINAFVSTGASTSVAHTLSDDCKSFFQDNAPAAVRKINPLSVNIWMLIIAMKVSRLLRHIPAAQSLPTRILPRLFSGAFGC